jgi:hypothetical protein
MPSGTDLLTAGKELQLFTSECGDRCSYIVAALHRNDKVRMKQLIQCLYHVSFTFKDLAFEMYELSGVLLEEPGIGFEVLEAADTYPWKQQVIQLLADINAIHARLFNLLNELSTLGVKAQSGRHLKRLLFDGIMLERALKDTGIVS